MSDCFLLSLVVLVGNMHASLKTVRGDSYDDCSKVILEVVDVMLNLLESIIFMHAIL